MTTLYRYQKINTQNIDAITNNKIFLSHPSNFNDPFDTFINARGDDETILKEISDFLISKQRDHAHYNELEDLKIRWGDGEADDPTTPHFSDSLKFFQAEYPSLFSEYKSRVLKENAFGHQQVKRYLRITDSLGLCSFSKSPAIASMWAYYADNHRGICVEYEIDHKKFPNNIKIDGIAYADGDSFENIDTMKDDDLLARTVIKNRCWSVESEVRIINTAQTNCLISIPGVKISKIILGLLTPAHEVHLFEQLFSDTPELGQIYMNHKDRSLHVKKLKFF